MRKLFMIFFIGFISNVSFCQDEMNAYYLYVKKADSLYQIKEFENSANAYQKAFETIDGKAFPNDRYNAACAFALINNFDSSFFHLYRLAEGSTIKFSNYEHLKNDKDLILLHKDKRWENLLEKVKANKDEVEKYLDKSLVARLDTIYKEDQKYRLELNEVETKYGWESEEVKKQWKIISEKDSLNLIKVKEILDNKGWLGPKIIGQQGNSTLFLVIQHSDLETQENYLPMMKEAVKNGNADPSSLALLEDRVALGKGKKQIYGSQIGRNDVTGKYYVLPLIDPDNVNKRREEVGLGSIQEYISIWDIIWDVEEYKTNNP